MASPKPIDDEMDDGLHECGYCGEKAETKPGIHQEHLCKDCLAAMCSKCGLVMGEETSHEHKGSGMCEMCDPNYEYKQYEDGEIVWKLAEGEEWDGENGKWFKYHEDADDDAHWEELEIAVCLECGKKWLEDEKGDCVKGKECGHQ